MSDLEGPLIYLSTSLTSSHRRKVAARHVIDLIVYIVRPSHPCSNDCYLPSRGLDERGGGMHHPVTVYHFDPVSRPAVTLIKLRKLQTAD
jgi:hypothetical protein